MELTITVAQQISSNIKRLRTEQGLTQNSLALRTGIARPNISRIESGKHTPSLKKLVVIAQALNVPISRILEGL